MNLPKYKLKQIIQLGKVFEKAYCGTIELRQYLKKFNIPEDVINDEINCFKIGDISASNFIKSIEYLIEEYKYMKGDE